MRQLTQPIQVGSILLKNRLVMPPMATGKSAQGVVTPQILEYYREKSRGGHIGLTSMQSFCYHIYIHNDPEVLCLLHEINKRSFLS